MTDTTTIAAISTAPGTGAIAIVRMSGSCAIEIATKVWHGQDINSLPPHTSQLGYITDSDGSYIDQVLLTIYKSPASYTGEDMVEIACHGSTYIQHAILSRLIDAGAKPAGPGEFSMRAVINSKMDIAQAEGVADLISSTSRASARMAMKQMRGGISDMLNKLTGSLTHLASLIELELDFSEEDVEFASRTELSELTEHIIRLLTSLINSYKTGTAIRNGITVAIIGAPNAGKSSLLNAMMHDDRAIVSDIPGTTRDIIEDTLIISGYSFRLTDTAGLRETDDPIERDGIDRTNRAIAKASIILYMIDACEPPHILHLPDTEHLIVLLNKSDLPNARNDAWRDTLQINDKHIINFSTKKPQDLTKLKTLLATIAEQMQEEAGEYIITSERHRTALVDALQSITEVRDTLTTSKPMDMLTQDIRHAINSLNAITGATITTSTLLHHLFANFCIGK